MPDRIYFRHAGLTYMVKGDDLYQYVPGTNSGMGEIGGFFSFIGKAFKAVAKIAKVAVPIVLTATGNPAGAAMFTQAAGLFSKQPRPQTTPYYPSAPDPNAQAAANYQAGMSSGARSGGGGGVMENAVGAGGFPPLPDTSKIAGAVKNSTLPLLLVGGAALLIATR